MASRRKFYERVLIVIGLFFVFLAITTLCLPLLGKVIGLNFESREGLLTLAVLQGVILFILPSVVSATMISGRPIRYLELNRMPSFMALLGVVFGYLIALPAINQIIYWNENIVFPEALSAWGETFRVMEENARNSSGIMLDTVSWGGMIVNLLIIALLTAFSEEIFFRGALQRTAASNGSPHTAIWLVALFFSAMHMQIFGFVPRLLLGAWFGYLLYWTRSLYVPVFAHFLNNGVVVVCSWLSARGFVYDFERFGVSEYGFPVAAFISALAFAAFVIFFKDFFFGYSQKRQWVGYV